MILKPCSLCTSRLYKGVSHVQGEDYSKVSIMCMHCGFEGPIESTLREAKIAWNIQYIKMNEEKV